MTWCRSYDAAETPPEAMSFRLPKEHPFRAFIEFCKDKDAVVMGPGLGLEFAKKAVSKTLDKIVCPVVLDADALNALAQMKKLPKLSGDTVITPHVGEAARLLKKDNEYVVQNTAECAKELSKKTGAVTVLKGHNTVVCEPDGGIFTNSTGTQAWPPAEAGTCSRAYRCSPETAAAIRCG